MFGFLKKILEPKSAEYIKQVEDASEDIISTGSAVFDDSPPFKMKKGEKFIFQVPAILGTFKSNGRGGYHGVTVSIPIMKGVRYRAGAGRVAVEKSWVFDEPGQLIFTTDRIVFNGKTKNSTVKLEKVIGMGFDPRLDALYIDKETGSDMCFELKSLPEVRKLATAFLFQRGRIEVETF